MSTKTIFAVIIILVLIILGWIFYSGSSNNPSPVTSNSSAPLTSGTNSSAVKFADQPYAQYAYQIDPANLNAMDVNTKQALSGFNVTAKNNADGTVTVSLTSTNPEYHNQSYTLKSGDKLYFIERSLGDDGGGEEAFLGDDTAVVVDANGNVIQH
ncbi:MAG: hypothetical protein PHV42_03045 [Candidatus Pacebacteria bacterium]|nr:hypothetical protein [Candidatus Paceibacterota bacterium]